MRILFLSDTHNQHDLLTDSLPYADVLIHSGDATGRGTIKEVRDFADWFSALKYPKKYFVAGNHDFLFQKDERFARLMFEDSVTYLQDEGEYIGETNVYIYGSPWQPNFHGWAFNLDEDALRVRWNHIPDFTNILVTHGPPLNIGDEIKPYGHHVGSYTLRERVDELKRLYVHAFGHIHEDGGIHSGKFINASMLDGTYRNMRKPIMIDLNEQDGSFNVL